MPPNKRRIKAALIKAGLFNAPNGRTVGATEIDEYESHYVVRFSPGLFNWQKATQPKLIVALKAEQWNAEAIGSDGLVAILKAAKV